MSWLRRVRAAVGMGITWAVAWALLGLGIELVHNIWPNPVGTLVDIWPAALALPAFFGGLAFSAVLGIAGRRRRFDQLSLPRFATWGALGGVLLGLIPGVLVAAGSGSVAEAAAVVGAVTLLTTISASGSLLLARMAEDRELAEAGSEAGRVGLTEDEARTLLGRER
jgi:drug/metabolite transporter (DMT)-like permease